MPRAREVTVMAVAIAVVGLAVRAVLVARGSFYWDDLILIAEASTNSIISPEYLFQSHDGHVMPGAFALSGLTTMVAPVQWWLPAILLVSGQAVVYLAVWRLIRVIAPDARGGALGVFVFFVFTPMSVPSFAWWAAALNTLPFQAALAYVVGSAVIIVRDQPVGRARLRLVVCSAVALLVALAFFEKSLLIGPIALIVALLVTPESLRRGRELWILLTAITVGWAVWVALVTTLDATEKSLPQALALGWQSINRTLVPSLIGGPWTWERWQPSAPMAFASGWAIAFGWLVLACAAVLAVRRTRRAIPILGALAVYVVGAQVAVMWPRSGEFTGDGTALTMRYLPDSALVMVIAAMLVLAEPRTIPAVATRTARRVTAGVLAAAFSVSSIIGTYEFGRSWVDNRTADYLNNVRAGLRANTDHVLIDQETPLEVLLPVAYPNNLVSRIFSRVQPRAEFGRSTDRLFVFDPMGHMVPGTVTGTRHTSASRGSCLAPGLGGTQELALSGPLMNLRWTAELPYCANIDGYLELWIEGRDRLRVPVRAGLGVVVAQMTGQGNTLSFRPVTPGLRLHVGAGRIGFPAVAAR